VRLFQKVKEIRSRQGALHFERFAVFETSLLSLYIHRIHKADEDAHLHSHPWNFVAMVLSGAYTARDTRGSRRKGPLSVSWMTRNGFHKIESILDGPVTTIFLAYGKHQPWGYLVDGQTVDSETYRRLKNEKRWTDG